MPLNNLTPEHLQQVLVEVAHEEADRYKAALEDALNEGWLLWSLNSGPIRMRGYMANTIDTDLPLVLEPAYLDLYQQGMAPDLAALQLWNQVQQQAMMTGQPIGDTSKLLWAMLLDLPKWVFQKFQQDFITLSKQFLKALPVPQPMMQQPGVQRFAGGGQIDVSPEPMDYGPDNGLRGFEDLTDGPGGPMDQYYWQNRQYDVAGNYLDQGSNHTQVVNINPYNQFIDNAVKARINAPQIGPQDESPTGDPRFLNLDKAPPLSQPIDTRLQATQQGLQGMGIDPRLSNLAPMAIATPEEIRKVNPEAYAYYGPTPDVYGKTYSGNLHVPQAAQIVDPNMPPPPSPLAAHAVVPNVEANPHEAAWEETSMHEFLHALESNYTSQDRQHLAAIMQVAPVPPVFNQHHPDGITGYFDAWNATNGYYEIPQLVKDFINQKLASIYGQ